MDASQIIDALGGTFKVAELCQVKPPSVSDWRKDGIPRARLMYLKVIRPDVFSEDLRPDVAWGVLRNSTQEKAGA